MTGMSLGSSSSSSSSILSSSTAAMYSIGIISTVPSTPPPRLSDTSTPSEFAVLMNNPLILTGVILLIIALTILVGVFCHLQRTRQRRQITEALLPPPPDVYMIGPRSSLSIRNVALSSLGSLTPPRAPSPVLSLSGRSSEFHSGSSDIYDVQRELRGFSFAARTASSRPASRSSFGTTKTRSTSAAQVWNNAEEQSRTRRHGVLWDVEAQGWERSLKDAVLTRDAEPRT
ncbi:hypothetical protein B0H16DRAFT_165138 [Mycena metata]|uniref:Uncharacterized protein n=1 Tax=Mycena metata TaxID=1033252 RepID=A0AAD7JUR4_9AGAR|nr:hypothetical protein B0H16DRAFT_165138 [Mycena metata]